MRHGPVRAARILPAPYISEYLQTGIWIFHLPLSLFYNIPCFGEVFPLMRFYVHVRNDVDFQQACWIQQNVLKSGLFMRRLSLFLLLEVLFGLFLGCFTESCWFAAFSGEKSLRSVLCPSSGLLAYFSNVQWRHLKRTGSG